MSVGPNPDPGVTQLLNAWRQGDVEALEQLNRRQSRVVELRYFAGLTIAETAEVLSVSISLVKDDWRMARTWLYHELTRK